MLPGWRAELGKVCLLIATLLGLGLTSGYLLPILLVGLALYLARLLWQMHHLQHWLATDPVATPPPVSAGIWGEIFERFYALLRHRDRERDRLQHAVGYLQESFSAIDDGVVMLNAARSIQWSNAAAQRLLGLKLPDDGGQMLTNLVRDPAFTRYLAATDGTASVKIASPVNSALLLEIHATVFGAQNCVVFVRDITALHRLETVRQDFVANLSHELRTPLTVIRGYIETMEEVVVKLGPPWPKALTQMHEQTRRMETLLRDLLLLSNLESMSSGENMAEEQIPLRPMLETLWETAQAAAQGSRQIMLTCDPALHMLGNRLQLESIFSNLIFNAVKYSEEGGKIHISCSLGESHAVFSVEDDGIGIDPVHFSRLTERFYRVDKSRSVQRGGTGLGLAIVKHALRYYAAELRIQSQPNKGSVFSCVFPANKFTLLPANEKKVLPSTGVSLNCHSC